MNSINTNKTNVRNRFLSILILSLGLLVLPMVQYSWGCTLYNAEIHAGSTSTDPDGLVYVVKNNTINFYAEWSNFAFSPANPLMITYDFGDNTTYQTTLNYDATSHSKSHTYTITGYFPVTVTIERISQTDETGASCKVYGTEDYAGGDGSEGTPYQISNAPQLLYLASHTDDYDNYFILTADISLSGLPFAAAVIAPDTDPSTIYHQGTKFTGNFNGDGHKITNLSITNSSGDDYLGLFGCVDAGGKITNLTVEDCSVTISGTDSRVLGALAGQLGGADAVIENCCAIDAAINGSNSSGSQLFGSLVGYIHTGGTVSRCYATGSVTGGDGALYLGSLAGANNGDIVDCYAWASITGGTNSDYLGGLVGYNAPAGPGDIDNCYSTGAVTGTYDVGGLCGYDFGIIDDSFWDTDTSGLMTSDGGEGKTTVEMQDINTFLGAGWNFDNIWMPYGTGYPLLVWQDNGDGTSENPYQINTASQLLYMANDTGNYDECFILTANIDLDGYTFETAVIAPDTNSDASFDGTAFTGSFDGNGHTISNLTISNGAYYIGLFGKIDGGMVTNLDVENVDISGTYNYFVGGLCGYNAGSITDCYSTGVVNGYCYVGGLCGRNESGSITNCYSTGYVTANGSYVGGLCGQNYSSSNITNCYSASNVSVSVNGTNGVGGLCGYNYNGSITNCYSTGSVTANSNYVGGLCGRKSNGSITNCYSTGAVSGNADVGGLCGFNNNDGSITKCYSTGTVNGNLYVGGLCGSISSGSITSSYFLDTAGPNNGFGTPLTDTQMKQQSSFVGWDFADIWYMSADSYPELYSSYQATNPTPSNTATGVSITTSLNWTSSSGATSHNVYFGTDSTPDSGEFQGNQSSTTYDCGTLELGTTYYWQIDEVNAYGTTAGTVWSFTTISGSTPPGAASNPSPANGATSVSLTDDLNWTAGSDATSHNVYFGTDSTPDSGEFQGNQSGVVFDPGTMTDATTYYWRIDEVNSYGTTTGTVWSFTTEDDTTVQVNITPSGAISAGALWKLYRKIDETYYPCDDGWHESGYTMQNLPVGTNYYIAAKDVDGYIPDGVAPSDDYYSALGGYIIDTARTVNSGSNVFSVVYVVPTTLYVSVSGDNGNTGNNPDSAYRNIQYAIDKNYGSVIFVTSGTYTENIDLDRVVSVEWDSGATKPIITGGSYNEPTVCVTANATLKNFVITGGDGDYGGGMYISSAATIRNCDFKNNNAGIKGGALYCQGTSSNTKFYDCTFGTSVANKVYGSIYHHSAEIYLTSGPSSITVSNVSIRGGSLSDSPYCDWDGKVW